jgi:protein-disulfide isomerase
VNENITKAEKIAKAREDARKLREAMKKKEDTKKLWIKILAILVPIVVIVVVAIFIVSGNKQTADSASIVQPANATEHGVIVGKNDTVVKPNVATPSASATSSATTAASKEAASEPAKIVIYQDYICPACKAFETQSLNELKSLRDSGKATVEYRFVTFLDERSSGTNYSSRAANAAACIVDQNPDKFYAFNTALYEQQPAEGSTGLPNQKLLDIAKSIGVTGIDDCVKNGTYRGWAADANKTALAIPLTGTPTILINGEKWDGKTSLTDAIAKK